MLITLKNKDTLIIGDFSFKCSIGRSGLSSKKKKVTWLHQEVFFLWVNFTTEPTE